VSQTYSDGKPIIIVMDNAKYNRAYSVQNYAKTLGIIIKYLPPYAPNLNLVERVWRFLKSELKNKYIENFEDFKEWIMNFCKNFKIYENEMKTIISNKIQILKAV
jgi:transposase